MVFPIKLKNHLLKKKAKKLGIKINAISNLSKNSSVIAEAPSSLGSVRIISRNYGPSKITFGAHSYIRSGIIESASNIGRFCSLGQNVTIGQAKKTHPIDWASTSHALCVDHKHSPEKTIIGNDVWLGDGAVIMEGVTIGHGAIVGKNAVVTKKVEPYQIVAGNPASPIKYRFDEHIRKKLLESNWWELDLEELKKLNYKNMGKFIGTINSINKQAQYKKVKINRKVVSPIKG